jgi:hypothetical protein
MSDMALDCYAKKCSKKHHFSDMHDKFKIKGFVIDHISNNTIMRNKKEVAAQVIVMTTTEFAKLLTHCTPLYNTMECIYTIPVRRQAMTAVTLVDGGIKKFEKLITLMDVYINKETEQFVKQIQTADNTIKELRLELKAFRQTEKKQRKKDRIPPPAYIDAYPPEI